MNKSDPAMRATLPLSESDLRHAVRRRLDARAQLEGGRVCEEFVLERGLVRIDLAIVARRFEGFELKSDHDSFARLAEQMHAYNRVFDRVTLITGSAFEDAARALMPGWWGLIVATRAGPERVVLNVTRPPATNPIQDAHSLAMLLWRDEALEVLVKEEIRPPRGASRATLHELLAMVVPTVRLRAHVVDCLRTRFDQSASAISAK